jgi:hypothetical protein
MVMFFFGLIYSSFIEWWIHKILFHEHGKKKDSIFAYHLRDHHKTAIKNKYIDSRHSPRESFGILLLIIIHLPICLLSVDFYIATMVYSIAFIVLHNYSHRSLEWTSKYMPWHVKHHMQNPNKNWNVVLPIADWIMKTNK